MRLAFNAVKTSNTLPEKCMKRALLWLALSSHSSLNTKAFSHIMQRFGNFEIAQSQIFHTTNLSAAFVNLKPIVPGHVLVIPKRVVVRLKDLTTEECDDLFQTVRLVESKIEAKFGASACNVAIQDGKEAGQSVAHVHVHILPRGTASNTIQGDDIYNELEKWAPREETITAPKLKIATDDERKPRSEEEMRSEADEFRKLFDNNDREMVDET